MTEKFWYPVVYMFAVTAVFSGILIALNEATAERVRRNEQSFRERAVVVAVGLADDDAPAERVNRLYRERIREVRPKASGPDDPGDIVEYRVLSPDGQSIVAYGVPLSGRGYWDRISGVIGIRSDRTSVIYIAFYQQNETPGLGAEIAEVPWRRQFGEGKQLALGDKPLAIVSMGAELTPHSVQAVTGATQTCTRLDRFMNAQLVAWRESTALGGRKEESR